jgi:hypothetical protein
VNESVYVISDDNIKYVCCNGNCQWLLSSIRKTVAVYTTDIEADVLDELDGHLELTLRIPRVVMRVLPHRAKRGLSVSSTVGSLVGHAQGSGQLLGIAASI